MPHIRKLYYRQIQKWIFIYFSHYFSPLWDARVVFVSSLLSEREGDYNEWLSITPLPSSLFIIRCSIKLPHTHTHASHSGWVWSRLLPYPLVNLFLSRGGHHAVWHWWVERLFFEQNYSHKEHYVNREKNTTTVSKGKLIITICIIITKNVTIETDINK